MGIIATYTVSENDDNLCIQLITHKNFTFQSFTQAIQDLIKHVASATQALHLQCSITRAQVYMLAHSFPSLTQLSVNAIHLENADFATFNTLRHLQGLHLQNCRKLTDEVLGYIKHFPQVKHIEISGERVALPKMSCIQQIKAKLQGAGAENRQAESPVVLTKNHSLQKLVLHGFHEFLGVGLTHVTKLSHLQTMQIEKCSSVEECDVRPLYHARPLALIQFIPEDDSSDSDSDSD